MHKKCPSGGISNLGRVAEIDGYGIHDLAGIESSIGDFLFSSIEHCLSTGKDGNMSAYFGEWKESQVPVRIHMDLELRPPLRSPYPILLNHR